VTVGNDLTRALDASTGKVVFQGAGPTAYCVASPAFGAGSLFVNGGYPDRRSLAFRFEGPGAFATAPVWETRKGTTYVPSPVFHDGTFYATPALADGRIFVRTKNRIHAIGDCTKRVGAGRP
jgi:hypothetical protein